MIAWRQKDPETVTFIINGEEHHARNIKHPDVIVKILQEAEQLSSYEQGQVRFYLFLLTN